MQSLDSSSRGSDHRLLDNMPRKKAPTQINKSKEFYIDKLRQMPNHMDKAQQPAIRYLDNNNEDVVCSLKGLKVLEKQRA